MSLQSQRHIRDLVFQTVSEAQNGGRSHEICYVKDTRTLYEFLDDGGSLSVNGTNTLSTARGGNTRWHAIAGIHETNKYAVPMTDIAQYTVFTGAELPELMFDLQGNLMMHLVNYDDI